MDVLHDVYVKILAGRARFHGRSSLHTWLFGVIRLTALSQRRKSRLASLLFVPIENGLQARPIPCEENDRHCSDLVRAAIESLSPKQSEILKLVFYHDLTVEEAAGVQRVSLGTARQHYARGKRHLRRLLAREGIAQP